MSVQLDSTSSYSTRKVVEGNRATGRKPKPTHRVVDTEPSHHPGKPMVTPAKQRTALGDIKNNPVSRLPQTVGKGQQLTSEKPKLLQSMRAKQAKEREHKLEEKTKCVPEPYTVLFDDGDFPDIETMSSKVPPEEPKPFEVPKYFSGLVSSYFQFQFNSSEELPSFNYKLELESTTRPVDTHPATGFWSELVDEKIPDLSLPSLDDIDL